MASDIAFVPAAVYRLFAYATAILTIFLWQKICPKGYQEEAGNLSVIVSEICDVVITIGAWWISYCYWLTSARH